MRGIGAISLIGLVGHVGAAQQTPAPKPDGPDIVVNGGVPPMTGGLWRFDQSAPLIVTETGRSGGGPPPRRWQACVAKGDSAAVIRQLVGGAPQAGNDEICERIRVTVDARRVHGGQYCTAVSAAGTMIRRSLRFSATLSPERMELSWRNRSSMGSEVNSGTNWHTTAQRIGECPMPLTPVAQAKAAPKPMQAAEPQEIPAGPAHDAAPPPARAPSPHASGDDIVVVARKLRRLRLHYASSGRILSWCHADVSSGDKRVDRVGCYILRACVREGNDDTKTALACFRRKVDEIDPPQAS